MKVVSISTRFFYLPNPNPVAKAVAREEIGENEIAVAPGDD